METKLERLEREAREAVKTAREIAEKAEADGGRAMTTDERESFEKSMNTGRALAEQIKTARSDARVLAEAKSLAELIGPGPAADVDAQGRVGSGKHQQSLGLEVVGSEAFKSAVASFPGSRVPEKSRFQTDPIAVKSLFIGGDSTSAGAFVTREQSGIIETLGRRPLTLRSLISVRRTGSDTVEYVRQVSHTNAAAPVAEATSSKPPKMNLTTGEAILEAQGGYKPEGAWKYERDSAVVKTIAEWVPATKRALADVAALEGLIDDELRADIAEAEETQILTGDGTGENLKGILNTSGTQKQAFDTDIFTTIRKAVTKARVVGRVNPNAILLSPADAEKVDLAKNKEGSFYAGGPFAGGVRTIWGLPYIESQTLPENKSVVADFSKAVLWDREQTTVTVTDSHADFFIRNLVAILAEERVAFALTRPLAFVLTDLA